MRGWRIAVISVCCLFTLAASAAAGYAAEETLTHYDTRTDLRVHFSNADAVIAQIRQGLRQRDDTITLTYRSHSDHMEDIGALVRDLMSFAVAETERPDEGDYIFQQYGGYEMQYSYQKDADAYCYTVRILPEYYTDRKQEQKVDAYIAALLEQWDFSSRTPDSEIVRTVCDFVTERTEYDRIHQKNSGYHLKSTAYGALINGYALCQGYAVTVYRLLRECGIGCRVITGTAVLPSGETEAHAWNLVRIDGRYYNLDLTWDDQQGSDAYYLCGASDFPDHTPDAAFASAEFRSEYPVAEYRYERKG